MDRSRLRMKQGLVARLSRILASAAMLACLEQGALAFETYRLVGADCAQETGLIVDADAESIHVLNVQGKYRTVPRASINYVLVYNTVENPIGEIDLSGPLHDLLRDVHLTDLEKASLVGWPIQFIEEMVVFFDLDGKTNLIDQDKLLAIRPSSTPADPARKVRIARPVAFSFGQNLPQCEEAVKDGVQPTRMISDKIQINEFLTRYEEGFNKLKRFQARTRFYARPFLFEKKSRIGFIITNTKYTQEIPVPTLPLFFQWSSGRPFSHQSVAAIGYKPIKWLPNVEPIFGVSSDLKLHFFSASLAGNLLALPAGKSFMDANKMFFTDFFQELKQDDLAVYPHFNYLALSGIDYGPYSVGVGVFYPIFGIYGDGYFREVLASRSSLLGRFTYTTMKLQARLLYSSIAASNRSPDEEDIRVALSSEYQGGTPPRTEAKLVDSLSDYSLKVKFLRVGADYELNEDLQFGLDQVILTGAYEETLFNTDRKLDFQQLTTAFTVKQQFGNYVALQGYLNLFHRTFKLDKEGDDDEQTRTQPSGSIAIEFIL